MDAFTIQRDATNLRSITRSDPSVLEILETSVHSTIYHYVTPDGADDGEWIKQKAEGPMFIVRRNASPEYAIYMLNRATLKNVTIPLVKGEMKAKTVGGGMLQVARRGEKVKRGVWFSELDSLGRFEVGITRICGPPSQRPDSAVPQSTLTPVTAARSSTPQSAGDGIAGDGFSRLFAGLLNSPAAGSSTPPSNPSQPTQPTPVTAPRLPSPPQQQQLHQPIPLVAQSDPSLPVVSQEIPFPPSHHPVSPSAAPPAPGSSLPPQSAFSPPPGQTVDDLLNSILGVGSPMGGFARPSAPPQQAQQQFQHQPPPHLQHQQPPHPAYPPPGPPPHVPLETKPEAQRIMQQNHHLSPGVQPRSMSNGASEAGRAPVGSDDSLSTTDPLAGIQSAQIGQQAPAHPSGPMNPMNANDLLAGISSNFPQQPQRPQTHSQMFSPSTPPLEPLQAPSQPLALVGSIVDALGGVPDLRPAGREGFVRVLENLVRNEPRFVDDIWQGYVRRMGGG